MLPRSDAQHLQLVCKADAHPVRVRRGPLQLVDFIFSGVRQDGVDIGVSAVVAGLVAQLPYERPGVLA